MVKTYLPLEPFWKNCRIALHPIAEHTKKRMLTGKKNRAAPTGPVIITKYAIVSSKNFISFQERRQNKKPRNFKRLKRVPTSKTMTSQ